MTVFAKVLRITPKKAKEWLAEDEKENAQHGRNNRKLSLRMVERYANDMRAGRWQLNGESVIFNGSSLLDGQHRLSAIVEANVPVDMVVVRGVERAAFKTIDSGSARTMAHVLQIQGYKSSFYLAAALALLFAYKKGNPFGGSNGGDGTPTKSEMEALLERNKALADYVNTAVSMRTPLVTPSAVAFCHYVFAQADKADADKFIGDLCTGDGVKATSPVGMLRDRLMEESAGGRRLDRRLVVYLIFRAWNATRTKERLQRLQIPRSATEGGRVSVDLPNIA